MRKPFSRRDNYVKHLRTVHSSREPRKSIDPVRQMSTSDLSADEQIVVGKAISNGGRGKSTSDDAGESLEGLEREDLLRLLIECQRKCQELEQELQVQRKRYERREDMYFRLFDKGSDDE